MQTNGQIHQKPYNKTSDVNIELDIIDFSEIDTLIENAKTLPHKPENYVCLIVSGSFFLMFILILMLVIFGLREFKN